MQGTVHSSRYTSLQTEFHLLHAGDLQCYAINALLEPCRWRFWVARTASLSSTQPCAKAPEMFLASWWSMWCSGVWEGNRKILTFCEFRRATHRTVFRFLRSKNDLCKCCRQYTDQNVSGKWQHCGLFSCMLSSSKTIEEEFTNTLWRIRSHP